MLVVGSGPGGALLANRLADSGLDVIVLEAGPQVDKDTFHPDIGRTIASYFWEGGMRATRGNVIMPTLQARVLGGGSVFNSAICMRATPAALATWGEQHGLDDIAGGALDPHYAAVEELLGIGPVDPRVQGRRNELFRQGCEALGWTVEPVHRAERGCRGSAQCMTGCRNEAKESVDRRPIRALVAGGGRVYTSVHVDRLILDGTQVRGVVGTTKCPDTHVAVHPVRITARCTVISAGAINTPRILQRSGVKGAPVGGNLRFHPSSFVLGVFDDDVSPWTGATQGYHSLQYLEHGIKLEALWATPSVFAMRFPTSGKQFKRCLKRYHRTAVFDAWISGDDSVGRVGNLPGDRADISYTFEPTDARRLQEANALLAEVFRAAGAREILTGIHGLPDVLRVDEAADTIRGASLKPSDFPTGSNHVFGSMAMGADPERHAVDPDCQVYGLQDCFVSDCSLFPSSPQVNPQHTAMALADRLGVRLAAQYS